MHPLQVFFAAMAVAAPVVEGEVAVSVSRDFVPPPLAAASVPSRGRTALDLLRECAVVETSFGGAFVERINGVPRPGERTGGRGWLYYVNGMIAQKGAGTCVPEPGDAVAWDFHPWERVRQVRALIGCYPQPFARAAWDRSSPVRVLFTPGAREKAHALAASLARRGVPGARVSPLAASETPGDFQAIVIGAWDELVRSPIVQDAVTHGAHSGLFVDGGVAGMRILDLAGAARSSHPRAGALVAVAGGATLPAALWLVTGTDTEQACRAADVLISRPERIRGLVSAVIAGDAVLPAPAIDPPPAAGGTEQGARRR